MVQSKFTDCKYASDTNLFIIIKKIHSPFAVGQSGQSVCNSDRPTKCPHTWHLVMKAEVVEAFAGEKTWAKLEDGTLAG